MKNRRELTAEEKADADRLKRIFREAKARAREAGMTLNQDILAERCGWSGQSAVSQYINGRIPLNMPAVYKLAIALGVRPEEISPTLAGVSEKKQFVSNPTQDLPNTTSHSVGSRRIPVVSWVQAGCWSEVIDLHEVGDAEEWIVIGDGSAGENTFALKVEGESMYDPSSPISFSQGDVIIVDPSRQPENKSLVVVRQNGNSEATFKQLIIEGGEKMLKALNPAWPNRIIRMTDDAVLCGVVIGKYQRF